MAHKKGGGSSRNGRDSNPQFRGIKAYGEANGLRPTDNYSDYVPLKSPAVVWVVNASDPLRFRQKSWSFPIVGTFPYLGWFERDAAQAFAQELAKGEALDVDVRGASAYSTLGWFRDPLLSTMIPKGPEALGQLANVVLHESLHATLYIPSQSYFNESLASFVADRLTPGYLVKARGAGSVELVAYERSEAESERWRKRLHETYEELSALYASSRPDDEKRAEKARILEALGRELKARRKLNNATLAQYRTYGTGEEELSALFRACNAEWPRFLATLRTLGPRSFSRPQQEELGTVLQPLIERQCPQSAR